MSKRRRDRQPNLPPEAYNAPAAIPQPENVKQANGQAAPAKRGATTPAPADVVDWQGEYGEVLGDLRRTFIIFSALVLAMIALSFVIR